jgi:hypothetical protein
VQHDQQRGVRRFPELPAQSFFKQAGQAGEVTEIEGVQVQLTSPPRASLDWFLPSTAAKCGDG